MILAAGFIPHNDSYEELELVDEVGALETCQCWREGSEGRKKERVKKKNHPCRDDTVCRVWCCLYCK